MTRRYLTVSIPYVNAAPHLGYALELVQADALARAFRLAGDEVRFLGGTDDHAIKNALAAEAAGMPTAAYVDQNAKRFQELATPLAITYDDFIRTGADQRHRPGVEKLWRASAARGDFYRARYAGHYCVGCEQFYDDDDLVEGRCPEHGTTPDWVEEDNWFFRLSRYGGRVVELLERGEIRIVPDVYAREALAMARRGLPDISVSRSIERARHWGIPVPGDPTQVVYVWWDALANYVTALGYGGDDERNLRRWWFESDERVHVIGKGILRFHAIYWPALLLSAGLPLPTALFVHPYLTANGRKLSKTTGHTVDPVETVRRFGTDAVRWWLLADVPRAADADYSDDRLIARADRDLANGVANLAHRILTMVQRYCDGRVDAPRAPSRIDLAPFAAFDLRRAVGAVRTTLADLNTTIEQVRPWQLVGKDERALADTLTTLVLRLGTLADHLRPLVPDMACRLDDLLAPGLDGRLPPPTPLRRRLARPPGGSERSS